MLFRKEWVEKCGAYIVNIGCVARYQDKIMNNSGCCEQRVYDRERAQ